MQLNFYNYLQVCAVIEVSRGNGGFRWSTRQYATRLFFVRKLTAGACPEGLRPRIPLPRTGAGYEANAGESVV
jgi:hypothetical protein